MLWLSSEISMRFGYIASIPPTRNIHY
ncbi:hypothetical protein M3J09_008970 [Ascochyta lentis]